ncbi:ABC transporter permease [Nocardioides sp. AX2bis]|uniref:ABC transporter permease n=1 Tax=Nocardioides sp. AX2bis TaxID=2653157 RepID=UPI0012F3B62D|nr:ABC-2 family transporter protein [Nocardioides sp. AX2bis]VXB46563.1 ABC transporter permease [Nocardioides sp. AX2bis]
MRSPVGTYLRLVRAGFREQSAYLLAAFGGLVANATFGLLKVAILFATVRAAGGELRGYDLAEMSAYIWLSQGLLGSVNLTGRTDMADRVRTGDVAVDFLRPLDVQAAAVATDTGRRLFALLPRGVPSVVIGALLVGMSTPGSAWTYLLGAVSVLLGIVLSCACVYLLAVVGFWIVETRGLQILYMVASGFLAGLFVPISLFPDWLHAVAVSTPFPSMMMYPVDLLSGRVEGLPALLLVAQQAAWLAAAAVLGQVLTRAGRRRLEVQGG